MLAAAVAVVILVGLVVLAVQAAAVAAVVLEQLTQAVAAAAVTLATSVYLAARELSSFVTLVQHSGVLAEQLLPQVDTPTTHLHRLARLRHKENLNGTFCKSC
jgi:hypothetical protein